MPVNLVSEDPHSSEARKLYSSSLQRKAKAMLSCQAAALGDWGQTCKKLEKG